MPESSKSSSVVPPFQDDDISDIRLDVCITNDQANLVDISSEEEDIDEEDIKEEDFEYETSSEVGDKEIALEDTNDE